VVPGIHRLSSCKEIKKEGSWVRGVDLKEHEYCSTAADEFIIGNLQIQ
jgi:hypothetical protein